MDLIVNIVIIVINHSFIHLATDLLPPLLFPRRIWCWSSHVHPPLFHDVLSSNFTAMSIEVERCFEIPFKFPYICF